MEFNREKLQFFRLRNLETLSQTETRKRTSL